MRKTEAVIGLTLIVLFAIVPTMQPLWTPLRPAIVRIVEVVAFPFGLARLSAQPPDATLLMPVAGVKVSRITDTWGAPRPGGRRHRGQDIFAPKRTAVHSATRGYVVRVGDNALGGKVVLIAGAGGRRYYYAHLEAFSPNLRVGMKDPSLGIAHARCMGHVNIPLPCAEIQVVTHFRRPCNSMDLTSH